MVVYCVQVRVKSECRQAFIAATLENARNTRREAGCLRFDVLQQSDDPDRFALYEVYRSPADVDAHKQTAHYAAWRQKVEDMMAEPRKGVKYQPLFPLAEGEWRAAEV
ncbi:MAG: antibiotic biosynthesis monooxygenase [Planctomycetota bacterium]|nr:antibiotic biosynthesis monooxygenase [Planctomycetota bacterium]